MRILVNLNPSFRGALFSYFPPSLLPASPSLPSLRPPEMDRGSMHRCIHSGLFHPTSSSLSRRHRIRGIVRTLVEVAQGMAHLHSSELVHGDLKPGESVQQSPRRWKVGPRRWKKAPQMAWSAPAHRLVGKPCIKTGLGAMYSCTITSPPTLTSPLPNSSQLTTHLTTRSQCSSEGEQS